MMSAFRIPLKQAAEKHRFANCVGVGKGNMFLESMSAAGFCERQTWVRP